MRMRWKVITLATVLMILTALVMGATALTEKEFHGAWPYSLPPAGHFNTYVPNNLALGIYWDLMEQPLALYKWSDGAWVPQLATSWKLVPPDKFVVNLRGGVKWSDGKPFTSEDVVTTWEIGRLMSWPAWEYLKDVEANGPNKVTFHISKPASVVGRYALRAQIRAHSVYGSWAGRVKKLVAEGKTRDSDEWKALRGEFEKFRPAKMIVSGPFQIDANSMTEAQVTLVKVPTAWNANKVGFDRLIIYNGETPVITPLVLARQVDYASHGFPPATEKQFVAEGIWIIRPPLYTGPALFFNHSIYPLNRKEVRQAIAYAVNREENGMIAMGESGRAVKYMTGFSDNLVPLWMSPANVKKLEQYDYDPARAEKILKGIGFTRGKDGIWATDKGDKMEYEIIVPAEYADWSASAENLAEQLTRFGIKTVVRAVTYSQHPIDIDAGRFQMAISAWGVGQPHPHFSYTIDLFIHNYVQAAGPGMNFKMVQDTAALGKVDLEKLVVESAAGFDEHEQKGDVTRIALAFNELLPIVPLWERYGNNPALENVRVGGWPDKDDPIYKNSVYSDSFTTLMILTGQLQPATR
ncbi:MAG: ABC transporter substrate-binding protein [Firmicutes bacterium]|nr:ABC transporter substrate-binding protein [Bacillota bacterium]